MLNTHSLWIPYTERVVHSFLLRFFCCSWCSVSFSFVFSLFRCILFWLLDLMMMFFRSFFKEIHRKIFKWLGYCKKHTNSVENLSGEKKKKTMTKCYVHRVKRTQTFLIFSQNVLLFSQCSLIIKFVCRLLKYFHPLAWDHVSKLRRINTLL